MEQIKQWRRINELFPQIVTNYMKYIIDEECYQMPREDKVLPIPTTEQLQQLYPDEHGDLLEFFKEDMSTLAHDLIERYDCDTLVKNLQDLPYLIRDLLDFELRLVTEYITDDRQSQTGGKFTYKGRKYVIRNGLRSGKYILVKNKKVYLSQI
jgi:hypothetical protein